jgi:class 3 adenylate cyclase
MDQGLHTLVFTDLVDSTHLTERVGDARARELFAAHDRAARALLASCGGREIDHTDGFFLIFDDVPGACVEIAADNLAAAREALDAAEALATASGVLPESETGRALAALRSTLA